MWVARSTNSLTESYPTSWAISVVPASGTPIEGMRHTTSEGMPIRSLSSRGRSTAGQESRNRSQSLAHASRRCSQLSRTMRSLLPSSALPGCPEGRGQRLVWTPRDCANALRDEAIARQSCKLHQPGSVGVIEQQALRDLDGQPGLSRAARADE